MLCLSGCAYNGPGSILVNRALSILLTLMVLWMQALPETRCLHTGNVLPITVLLTTASHNCCHADCDRSSTLSPESIRGRSCYVEAPSDTSSIWNKVKIASIQAVLVLVRLRFSESASQTERPAITAESRAPPWIARRLQLSYLTYCSLLI